MPVMGTLVTIEVVDRDDTPESRDEREQALDRSFAWFLAIESCCTRFDPDSELSRLCGQPGVTVTVTTLLLQAIQFAIAVADDTGGAFDPTVGLRMERRGFDRDHRSGRRVSTAIDADDAASFRDVRVDAASHTVTLLRPLLLDLGAVAKGLAVDMAARELRPFRDFAIDAGGDLYLGGRSAAGGRWNVGVRHPRHENAIMETLRVSDRAVCTSGDYERRSPVDGGPHIVPAPGHGSSEVASVTVVGSSAMVADALGTAAFVLGPAEGLRLLERHGVDGLIVSPALEWHATPGMRIDYDLGHTAATPDGFSALLQDSEGAASPHPDRDRRAGDAEHGARARPARAR